MDTNWTEFFLRVTDKSGCAERIELVFSDSEGKEICFKLKKKNAEYLSKQLNKAIEFV